MRIKPCEIYFCVAASQFALYVLEHPVAKDDKTKIIEGYLVAEVF